MLLVRIFARVRLPELPRTGVLFGDRYVSSVLVAENSFDKASNFLAPFGHRRYPAVE